MPYGSGQMELTMRIAMQVLKRAARPALFVAALTMLAPAAQAENKPSPGALAAAHELVTVMGASNAFNPLIAGVVENAKLLYLQQNPALSKDLNEIAAKMRTDLAPRFTELTNEMARLYATEFSEQELKEILAFYKSPVGEKLLTQQPQIGDRSMKFAQDWANKLSETVIAKMRVELKKRGHQL